VTRLARPLALTALLLTAALLSGASSEAQSSTEQIQSYNVEWVIEPSGDVLVTEVITYDFGPNERHGIFRDIKVRSVYDDTHDRVIWVHDVVVSASADTPNDVSLSHEGDLLRIRIGDPDETIRGVHTYRIDYRLEGALNRFEEDHDELFAIAIGPGWDVQIENAVITVRAPANFLEVLCFAGPVQSTRSCDEASVEGDVARFSQAFLPRGQVVTPVLALPVGAVDVKPPILEERWSLERAFSLTPWTIGLALLALVVSVGSVTRLLWMRGRDRRFVGSVVDIAFGSGSGETQRVPLFEDPEDTAIEFAPPEDTLPGQMGTLIDEVAHPLDVTATIVDLAVRGYLAIDEIEGEGWFAKSDWRLRRLKPADAELREYERELLDGLFEDGEEVLLSDLKTEFVDSLRAVQDDLYRDVVDAGWFLRRPDRVRQLWLVGGLLALAAGVAVTVLLAVFTTFALVGVSLVLGGGLLALTSNRMPRRTAKGTGMMRRALGFQRAIATAERDRARWEEEQGIFSKYLPYAIVFGLTDRWAKAFEGLDAEATGVGSWYLADRPFTTLAFASMVGDFTKTTSGTIVATPASSGSSGFGGGGFAGGGIGGGGGGSW
jgi:hypothetical protein